jgi:hypothetical protein
MLSRSNVKRAKRKGPLSLGESGTGHVDRWTFLLLRDLHRLDQGIQLVKGGRKISRRCRIQNTGDGFIVKRPAGVRIFDIGIGNDPIGEIGKGLLQCPKGHIWQQAGLPI